MRNVRNGQGVGGDILAHRAIAARRRLRQLAGFVTQRQRQPVDLRFGGEIQFRPRREAQKAADAGGEFVDLLCREGIGERHHPLRMGDLAKGLGRCGADLPRGAVGAGELRKRLFQRLQLALGAVVFRVRDRRRVLLVIVEIGPLQKIDKRHHARRGLILVEQGEVGRVIFGRHRNGIRRLRLPHAVFRFRHPLPPSAFAGAP